MFNVIFKSFSGRKNKTLDAIESIREEGIERRAMSSAGCFSWGPTAFKTENKRFYVSDIWFGRERRGMGKTFTTFELEILCDLLNEWIEFPIYVKSIHISRMWNDTHFIDFDERWSRLKVYERGI